MSLEQRGAYDEMLCVSWQIGPLPDDPELLAKLIKVDKKTFKRVWKEPLKGCWEKTDSGLINERLEKEREWAKSKIVKAKKAARHRWDGANSNTDALQTHDRQDADASPKQCHPDPDPDPDKEEEEEERASASPPRWRKAVYWDPKPTWKPDHPSLQTAQLKVEADYLKRLAKEFPNVDVPADIRNMKNYAIDNPGWARVKRNWKITLGKWIRRSDEKLHDARFKAQQARASPAESLVAQEESWRADDDDVINKSITACENKYGLHKDGELAEGSKTRYCKHNCGYYVTKKGG